MTTCPREPNPGDRITASWMRELVRYVRGLTPIAGPGVKVERKPDGTVIKAEAASAVRPSAALPGRYCIKEVSVTPAQGEDPPTAAVTFKNCYFRCGGRTYEGNVTEVSVELPAIVALRIDLTGSQPVATLMPYEDFAGMNEDEKDNDYYLMPLYKFDAHGAVECDFRVGPDAAQWEFPG